MPKEIQDALVLEGDELGQAIELVRLAMHVGAQI